MTREEVVSDLLGAVPGLRAALDRWRQDRPPTDDGLADELGAVARHLVGPDGAVGPHLPAAVGVVERCLRDGPHEVRMAAGMGFVFTLWLGLVGRPGAEVGRRLPPYCRAVWDTCPEVYERFRSAFERAGWPPGVAPAGPDMAPDPAGL